MSAETNPIIVLQSLYKTVEQHPVLIDLNLSIQSGEVVGIRGPSGSGKSTLLRLIQGLDQKDSGSIRVDGKSSMIFQHFNLFPHMTVLENIIYAPYHVLKLEKDQAISQARELLKQVQLAHKESAYPRQLSGGQKQRIAIVRALAISPDILLFDEPTSALDPAMTLEVERVIQEISEAKQRTMLIVSHEESFLERIATRLITLKHGQIIEDMT